MRVKNDIKLYELKNVLEEPVFIDKFNVSTLNYWHNDQIINGYDTLQDYKEISTNDDLDGKFYSLPNDLIETSNELVDSFQAVDKIINERLKKLEFEYCLNIFVCFCVLSCVSHIFIFFIARLSKSG